MIDLVQIRGPRNHFNAKDSGYRETDHSWKWPCSAITAYSTELKQMSMIESTRPQGRLYRSIYFNIAGMWQQLGRMMQNAMEQIGF